MCYVRYVHIWFRVCALTCTAQQEKVARRASGACGFMNWCDKKRLTISYRPEPQFLPLPRNNSVIAWSPAEPSPAPNAIPSRSIDKYRIYSNDSEKMLYPINICQRYLQAPQYSISLCIFRLFFIHSTVNSCPFLDHKNRHSKRFISLIFSNFFPSIHFWTTTKQRVRISGILNGSRKIP